jgi:hypothetical protein
MCTSWFDPILEKVIMIQFGSIVSDVCIKLQIDLTDDLMNGLAMGLLGYGW